MTSKQALYRLYKYLKYSLKEDAPGRIRVIEKYYNIVVKDLERLEAYRILDKHHLIGDIDVQKVDVADAKGTHIEYELRCDFMSIFIPKEEYEIIKEWLDLELAIKKQVGGEI